jgi:CheY-like chemotaxis protein
MSYTMRWSGRHIGRSVQAPLIAGTEREITLVVEDDEDVRANTIAMLPELGYGILEAPDGPSMVEILGRTLRVDLLFTDVGLPGD